LGVAFNTVVGASFSQVKISAPRTNYDAAMLQFEQLVSNKNFLLTFIDTLESQKTFNIRDK
jgi:plexin A